ncbi:MAG TPA: RHS repeat-associated core domain-containing protein [Pyrinomonadaceae bacterium]
MPRDTDALDKVTSYEYDANGNKTATVDALDRRTTYTYDAANRLTRTTYPNNTSINYTYNFRDHKLTETDQAGRVTTYTYDKSGQLTKVKYPDNAEVSHSYDPIGREAATTDERGNTTQYEYDPSCACSERIGKVTDALGHATTYKFDAAGRLTSFMDAANRETRFTYDVRNRLLQTIFADGTSGRQTYDGAGHKLTETDQAGNLTTFAYDGAGELLSVTDSLNHTTSYAYDATRNLLSVTDANNHSTSYEYDKLNRITKRTLPLGMFETYAYNAVGSLTSKTDFNGKLTAYSYDTLNRPTSKTPPSTSGEQAVTFTYKPTGKRATMSDASGATTYTYDSRDRLTTKATPQGALIYTYDAAGNVLSVRSSNVSGTSVDYTYDALNRLASVTDNHLSAGTNTYSYDLNDNLIGEVSANGVQSTLAFDAVDNLTSLTVSKSGTTLAGFAYTLSPTGQRRSVVESNGRSVSYSYDALLRLTNESIAGDANPASNGAINYSLDAVGNRLARTSTLSALPSTSSTYDANDRLASDSYDASGNTTSASGNAYAYNFENRIKSVNSGAVTITYDGDGNRVAKTTGGVTTKYLVDELNPTGYAQVLEEVTGGAVQRRYTYGNSLVSQNQLVAGDWAASFYGADAHGSTRLLTDVTGSITDAYTYDAFGNLIAQAGATPNSYLYNAEQFEGDLGSYYLRERHYQPQSGRFLTRDPFSGFINEPRTLHKYGYVGADPVNLIDPSGLTETTEYKLRATIQPKASIRIPCAIAKVTDLLNLDPALMLAAQTVELIICGCKPATGTSVGQNYSAGKQLEQEIAQAFKDLGYTAGPQYVPVPGHGRGRFLDVVVRNGAGDIVLAIEAKVGKSPYRGLQRAKDAILRKGGLPLAVVRRACR